MADDKIPLEPPPAYDAAGLEHTPLIAGVPAQPRQNTARALLPLDLPALNALRGRRVILASASPRRKQLLAQVRLSAAKVD